MSQIPAGCAGSETAVAYIPPTPGNRERDRASQSLDSLTVTNGSGREPDRWYAQWAGGYVEITDKLLSTCICPADLLGVPCEWDEILLEGCNMIRLCKTISKYTTHVCPDGASREPRDLDQPRACGHIHWEIDISCRFVATSHRNVNRKCNQVLRKNRLCSAGHDFEYARMTARDAYDVHIAAARAAGSCGRVQFGWTF